LPTPAGPQPAAQALLLAVGALAFDEKRQPAFELRHPGGLGLEPRENLGHALKAEFAKLVR
jgi:hypothetical protein